MYILTGLGLSAEYLSARTLPDLQQPPSTLTSTEFLLGADGEFKCSPICLFETLSVLKYLLN